MTPTGLLSAHVLSLFVTLDALIAVSIKAAGCPLCKGSLHALLQSGDGEIFEQGSDWL